MSNKMDEIMVRVRRAEGRLASIESELHVLDERMKAASDILGSPKKKKRSSSGSVSSSTGSKKKINKGNRKITPIKLPKIRESEEVKKLIKLNENYRRDSPVPWNRLTMNDLVSLNKSLKMQGSAASGKTIRPNLTQTGGNKMKILSKVNDPAHLIKNDSKVKGSNTAKKASKIIPKGTPNNRGRTMEMFDPKTGRRYLNPVRNMWCMHVYEKSTIKNLIEGRNDVLCPHPGCTNKMPVSILDLIAVEKKPIRASVTASVKKTIPMKA
ncbi:uncharacterized protein LOC126351409 isoform X2 [Schistocerca gregaria]|uniref:uncharacterized protein LOC126351409 isoform X2 n=1 Tax=Schistocerca gregaria TaxID=7010 RepID=UPI00211E1814|nr:uncharacterized protein LOC126351409 isoform X2 [Schistocerca gregaria]